MARATALVMRDPTGGTVGSPAPRALCVCVYVCSGWRGSAPRSGQESQDSRVTRSVISESGQVEEAGFH